ncbi:hypothetical protein DDZ18_04660 [Marinicauda salina]|uniref:Tetratricopeptide repeat protein n=1 Tax=Marinicauda salina TaxID=2135793 RepID=A0A2U2BY00_9PROT|nr:hypothetical protein [Marinicauda salina]PWE18886.1 hypothetical protein DDZ18_04660 [Marinicauda salina]
MALRAAALSALLAAAPGPALAQMGPHVGPETYEQVRGAPLGEAERHVWRVEIASGEDDESETVEHEAAYGPDWFAWTDGGTDEYTLVDLAARRKLVWTPDRESLLNGSLHAAARRNLDIYVALSQGGERDRIDFGEAGVFDRFWLEAAMGLAPRPAELAFDEALGRLSAARDGETIFRAFYAAGEDSPCVRDPLSGGQARRAFIFLQHAAPVHPDIVERLVSQVVFPCAVSFTVYSPESPDGRTEQWVLADAQEDGGPALPPATPVLPGPALLNETAGPAALAAVTGEAGPPPTPDDLAARVRALAEAGDFAGAYLAAARETAHFGPCPAEADEAARPACAAAEAMIARAEGDPAFEQAVDAVAAATSGDPAAAIDALRPHLDRDDLAGAHARALVAEALTTWGQEGLETYPDLDPAGLLAEALVIDPYAPDTYARLGRRFLAAGAPEAAWALFDLGRALPAREPTPLLAQLGEIEARIEALAPGFFAPGGEGAR